MLTLTNTQAGPRGFNAVAGPVLVEPGATAEAKVFEREREHIEATGWFDVSGDYEPDPGAAATSGGEKSAGEAKPVDDVLAMAEDPQVKFMTFKAEAGKLLGDATPATKAEIVAALTALQAEG